MATLTTDEFLDYLKRSELLEGAEYDAVLTSLRQEAPYLFNDASQLATELTKRNYLTSWHVRQLMKRKYKGFYLRQYRILGHLGSGGMSAVYLAEHTVMKRRVAIKVLPKRRLNPVYLDRFAREAQAIASLDSTHVVRAYDVDRFEDVHYIVMEYFEGQNLRQLVDKEGPLAFEDAVNYIRQAALGLADAHKSGIVHRDVKPENIVVDEHEFVKILDLGLALLDENAFALNGTAVDEDKILGTADYLAPEQALDSHNVDARADIYGLGATLYFCLTGHPPFPTGSISERLLAHQRKEPESVFKERPDAPVDLVEICAKMMAKKPEDRVQSARQVADVMKEWLIVKGFANRYDFAYDKNSTINAEDIDQFTSDSNAEERFLTSAYSDSATEPGFARSAESFRMSAAELAVASSRRQDNEVDLYDASESGGSLSHIHASTDVQRRPTSSDNLLLSKETGRSHIADPFELALNEITDSYKSQSSTELATPIVGASSASATLQTVAVASQPETTSTHLSANTSQHASVASGGAQALQEPSRNAPLDSGDSLPETEWYKLVPVWFWTVAVAGYAAAIFMAGVLFTLLLRINQ
ncbi:MAG: serine/threonine-protein kinase [Planctomycetia bacterium]|nr:serine/threonine-protein kinase [Planctomycetia bacterium]